jgi:hypothetical protein
MALVAYPADFKEPVVDGFTLAPKERNTQIVTGRGPSRVRSQSLGNVFVIEATIKVDRLNTKTNFAAFENFLKYDINYGDDWFTANWFTGLGFAASTYAFRFADIKQDETGYRSFYRCTILMALATEVPQPTAAWPRSTTDPGFLDQRFG